MCVTRPSVQVRWSMAANRRLCQVCLGLLCLALMAGLCEPNGMNKPLGASNDKESVCSAMAASDCLCRRPRKKEQSLICSKEDCMEKLPTDDIPDSQVNEVVSLLVRRQPNITRIGSEELRRLGRIRHIRIYRCQISEVAANAFVGLNFVERLDLHRNSLSEIPSAIRYLRNLRFLNLGGNQITHFTEDAFYSNSHLERLILNRNHLTTLPHLLPTSLIKLGVSRNKMMSLGNLERLTKLETLNADGNMLTEFPQLPGSVKVLNLCSNRIRGLISLKHLPNVRAINVNHNLEIGDITMSTFRDSRSPSSLTTFQASNSGIRSISSNAFACSPRLKHVDISHNSIQTYHASWFAGNRGLRSVFVAGNRWHCSCDVESSLRHIAHTFKLRRSTMGEKRVVKGFPTVLEDDSFAHDFDNVTCRHEMNIPCEEFRLGKSNCAGRDDGETALIPLLRAIGTTSKPTTASTAMTKPTTTSSTTKPVTTSAATTTTTTTKLTTTSATTTKPTTTSTVTTKPTTTTTTTKPTTTSAATTKSTTTTTTTKLTTVTTAKVTSARQTTAEVVAPPIQTIPGEEQETRKMETKMTQPSTTSTTTTTTTTTSEPVIEWCLKDGRKCHFPFVYDGEEHNECTGFRKWCSPTFNYDNDEEWDYCREC